MSTEEREERRRIRANSVGRLSGVEQTVQTVVAAQRWRSRTASNVGANRAGSPRYAEPTASPRDSPAVEAAAAQPAAAAQLSSPPASAAAAAAAAAAAEGSSAQAAQAREASQDGVIEAMSTQHGDGMSAESREELSRELKRARKKFSELDLDGNGVLNGDELHVSRPIHMPARPSLPA
jgi:hypothetical protein